MNDFITRTRIGPTTYLAPAGPLVDDDAIELLKAAIDQCTVNQQVQVLLDLNKVSLISGRALELMLDARARLLTLGGRLKVANPSALLRDVFRATGFDNYVSLVDLATARTVKMSQLDPPGQKRKLGDILLDRGLLKAEQVAEATRLQKQSGKRIGRIVVEKNWVPEAELLKALSEQLGVPYVTLRPGMYDLAASRLVDIALAKRCEMLPMFRVHDTCLLYTSPSPRD